MDKVYCILCLLLIGCYPHDAHSQSCDQLIYYRDVELHKDYKLLCEKYGRNEDMIKIALKQKEELLNYKGWSDNFSIKESIDDGAEFTKMKLQKTLESFCELVTSAYEVIAPALNVAKTTAKKTIITAEKVYKIITTTKDIAELRKIHEENAREMIVSLLLKQGTAIEKTMAMTIDHKRKIKEWKEDLSDREELKEVVADMLSLIEKTINEYDTKLKENVYLLYEMNEIQKGITQYIIQNCKEKTVNEDPSKKQTKPVVNISTDTKSSKNSFYVFFTTEVTLNLFPLKTFTVISAPTLYQGEIGDNMIAQKESFINKIELQILNDPKWAKEIDYKTPEQNKTIKQRTLDVIDGDRHDNIDENTIKKKKEIVKALSDNNYQAISVVYYPKENAPLMKSKLECQQAIDSFKQTLNAFDGKINFIHLQ